MYDIAFFPPLAGTRTLTPRPFVQKFQPADSFFPGRSPAPTPLGQRPQTPTWFLRLLRSTYETTVLDFVRQKILAQLEGSYKEWHGVFEMCAELGVSILSKHALQHVREMHADWRHLVREFVACTCRTLQSLCIRLVEMLPDKFSEHMPKSVKYVSGFVFRSFNEFLERLLGRFQQLIMDKITVALHKDLSVLVGGDACLVPLSLQPTPEPLQIIQALYVVRACLMQEMHN